MTEEEMLYDDTHIALLEDIWGEGFLSPGGPDEVARVLEGLDLSGKTVLDIGCGSGAIAVLLARDYGAGSVVGIDVEDDVCNAAARLAEKEGVADRVSIRKVVPGPLDFADQSFDVVVMSLVLSYIDHPQDLLWECRRVLRPGGRLVLSSMIPDADSSKLYLDLVNRLQELPEEGLPEGHTRESLLASTRAYAESAAELLRLEEDSDDPCGATVVSGEGVGHLIWRSVRW